MDYKCLRNEDSEVYELVAKEGNRQLTQINLIPSENICSEAVMESTGSILTNKYAEGYANKRYYQGNEFVDKVELLAIERAKKLFGAEHVNVQPNSGSPANMAVYFGLLEYGDKIMALNLMHGGHLTHGCKVNFSGKLYNFIEYGVEEDGFLDMDKIREIALKEKPKLIVCGFTAYPRKINFKKFAEIAREVEAYSMADISHIAGLIASGVHENPIPYFDVVTTTTHKTLRGPRSAIIMCKESLGKKIDKAVFPGLQGGPHEHVIAAKAVAFKEAMSDEFKVYSKQVVKNAKVLADSLMSEGISLVSNGTDNHLILIDLIKSLGAKGLGRDVAIALEETGIITNCNTIPFDPSTPFRPSGIRIGTPFVTTMGMKEQEMKKIGQLMALVIKNYQDDEVKAKVGKEVKEIFSCGLDSNVFKA
ncbi:MAG: serine hydroxymethyltransferase [Nanoarchaeota archaeon]|nr:serine hydroxymethyltransferase [Nanoarchaeota archaeon]